jgi:hypothetical protein
MTIFRRAGGSSRDARRAVRRDRRDAAPLLANDADRLGSWTLSEQGGPSLGAQTKQAQTKQAQTKQAQTKQAQTKQAQTKQAQTNPSMDHYERMAITFGAQWKGVVCPMWIRLWGTVHIGR